MQHLVRFKTADGRDGHHVATSLDEAVRFAERVRNGEGATDVMLFRMTQVPLEFKAYYRAEVVVGEPDQPVSPPVPLHTRPLGPEDGPPLPVDGGHDAGGNGRRLFSRG